MAFKQQYRNDINWEECPYRVDAPKRIKNIYGTSTRATGRTINHEFAGIIWKRHLKPIFDNRHRLPSDRQASDVFLIKRMQSLRRTLFNHDTSDFGISQKIINLFMKDLWAFNELPNCVELNLHAPLDRTMVEKLSSPPKTWKAWTKATLTNPNTVSDYQSIQQALRQLCAETTGFHMLIEMEQFIWHRIPLGNHVG
jgi:hypothetical protein